MTTAPAMPALDTLDTDELSRLYSEAGRLLQERMEADLPAVVLESIREALAEQGDTREPARAVFSTTEWENGYFWYAGGAEVTFTDGTTDPVDIDDTDADEVLSDHASYLTDPLDSTDTLTVVFDPPSACMG